MRKKLLAGAAVTALVGAAGFNPAFAQNPPLMNWSGFYAGVHAGWGQARFSGTWVNLSSPGTFPFKTKPSGFLGGVHAGQNWQNNMFIYGWEADVSGMGWKKTVNVNDPNNDSASVTTRVSLLASLRGRLGMFLNPQTHVYLTGGLGYANAKATAFHTGESGTAKFNDFGGVVGAGAEWKQNQNVSWRLEGLWYIFNDSKTIALPSGDHVITIKFKDVVAVRGGVTWHY